MAVFKLDNLSELVDAALDIETVDAEKLRALLDAQYAVDVADVLERLDEHERLTVFQLLDPDLAAEVLDELGTFATRHLLDNLPDAQIIDLLSRMPMDDVAEILAEDVPGRRDELLVMLPSEVVAEISGLLDFPPQSAGRLMVRKFVRIDKNLTNDEALAHLRRVDSKVETLHDVYVLNGGSRLEGVCSVRELINMRPDQRVSDIMTTEVISITPDVDQEKAARLLGRYDLLALPVVSEDGRMLGIITVDDAIDVLAQENTEDLLRFGGVAGDANDQPYFTIPILRVIRTRFVWLLLLFLADTFTGNVLRVFDQQLAAVVALSFYIPLLIGTGGNAGAQTVSTIIRGLAVGDVQFRDTLRVLRREIVSGALLGTMLGLVAGFRAYLWDNDSQIAIIVGVTVLVVCTWANTIASLIPLVAKRLNIDPAVVSAPMITTLVDATGLFIYLSIATALLGL